jgi:hypothetical protein
MLQVTCRQSGRCNLSGELRTHTMEEARVVGEGTLRRGACGSLEEFPHGLRYTAFVLRLVWVVVVVPLVTGAVLAFVLNVPERSPTPATSPVGAERTSPTIPFREDNSKDDP